MACEREQIFAIKSNTDINSKLNSIFGLPRIQKHTQK